MRDVDESGHELMTIDELSAALRLSRKTLLNWRPQGIGPRGFKVGKAVRYRRTEVARWLAEQEAADSQVSMR